MSAQDPSNPTGPAGHRSNGHGLASGAPANRLDHLGSAEPTALPAAPRVWLWPGLVLALLGAQALIAVVTVVLATRDPTFAVEPDYYQKALHWDRTAAQRRADEQLGWRLQAGVGFEATVRGERLLECVLRDAAGTPLADAQVEVTAFHHARAADRLTQTLPATAPGQYAAWLPLRRTGLWELRFTVRRGDHTFTHSQLCEVSRPTGVRS